jgi:Bor protein
MRRTLRLVPAVALVLTLPACYHVTVDTGLPASSTVVEKPWASSFIDGLVPPSTLETQSKCPGGVSKVETQLSFLNLLVGAITFGIYTPMSIKVTCAQGGRASIPSGAPTVPVGASATPEALGTALERAIQMSSERGVPVYVTR